MYAYTNEDVNESKSDISYLVCSRVLSDHPSIPALSLPITMVTLLLVLSAFWRLDLAWTRNFLIDTRAGAIGLGVTIISRSW
jgi:hypothetical protein